MTEDSEIEPAVYLVTPRPTKNRGSILMAAMLGLAQALGFENVREQTVQLADAAGNADLDLVFGDLPPLE